MADKFEQVGKVLARGAVQMVPGGAVALELLTAILPNNDENLRKAIWEDLQEGFTKVQEEVNRLKARVGKLEELGALRTLKLQREFASAYAETSGEAKREALINVAAKQFDSTWLDSEMRSYWFQVVRSLSDHQIVALRDLAEHRRIRVSRAHRRVVDVAYDEDKSVAIAQLLFDLDALHLVRRETYRYKSGEASDQFTLTPQGEATVRAMAPVTAEAAPKEPGVA